MSQDPQQARWWRRPVSRRTALKGGLLGGAALFFPWTGNKRRLPVPSAPGGLGFSPVAAGSGKAVQVPDGYLAEVLLRWGDPVLPGAPPFDPSRQSVRAQSMQFGYNADYVGYLPLQPGGAASQHGLLVVNHESPNPTLMFPGYAASEVTREQVDIQLAALGVSFVEVYSDVDDRWQVRRDSPRNWRVTGLSPTLLSGPAAGHPWTRTSADPSGTRVIGMLANCSAGMTPWGTLLTSEENFHLFFGDRDDLEQDDPRFQIFIDYGFPLKRTQYGFERIYDRFRIDREPNESFRFGYQVEIDPFDPSWTPRKRTGLGRLHSEGSSVALTAAGRAVCYYGDDFVFQYVYKFVSRQAMLPGDRTHNRQLLDDGTLHTARFNADGTGDWLPLIAGQGSLNRSNGFPSQAEVCLNTIRAASLAGGTAMDRPEDIVIHPHTRKVYIALTKNPFRGDPNSAAPGADAANPRQPNHAGHIIELEEEGGEHGAVRFRWRIFMLCGDPNAADSFYAGYPKSKVSRMACPDNMVFDIDGNLWVATDGQQDVFGEPDALFAVPTEGPERGFSRRFLTGVTASEITGPCFTPDCSSLFVAVQHPGEGGTLDEPISSWPDGHQPPRPSVIAVRAADGRQVGKAPAP